MENELTITETAKYLEVQKSHIYQVIENGFLQTRQSVRGTVILESQVHEYDRYRRLPPNQRKKARRKILAKMEAV